MNKNTMLRILLLQTAVLLQVGCSDHQPHEIVEPGLPQMPGLFSGEKGYFEIELDR